MNKAFAQRSFLMLMGLWLGLVCGVGYLVAPSIFKVLADKQVAGVVAGEIFKNTALLTIVMMSFLLGFAQYLSRCGFTIYRFVRLYLGIILALTLLGVFIIQPLMTELRNAALLQGLPVMQSENAWRFGALHAVSSLIFLLEAILGLSVFWRLTK